MNVKLVVNKYLAICQKDVITTEKVIIKSYIKQMGFFYEDIPFLQGYLIDISEELVDKVTDYNINNCIVLDLDFIIQIFELLIPSSEKKINGMVYTPYEIKNIMIEKTFSNFHKSHIPYICDPACGCGSFLVSITKYLCLRYSLSFSYVIDNYIFGVDIFEHNIEKTKVLLCVLALENDEQLSCQFNLLHSNSLQLDWKEAFSKVFTQGGFDIVIGNPPYVNSRNMNSQTKEALKKWSTTKQGNVDLYIPFFELAMSILNVNGILCFISVNSFIKSLYGRGIRNLFSSLGYELQIIDFSSFQIFKDILSYTGIFYIEKEKKNNTIKYLKCTSLEDIVRMNGNTAKYNYSDFEVDAPWYLVNKSEIDIKSSLCGFEKKLGDYQIKNGLATLKNDVYFFKPVDEDEKYFYRTYDNKIIKIEKDICIDVIKPNIVRSESEISEKIEKAIFPYHITENRYVLIDELFFKETYPYAYKFLLNVKGLLKQRDKGNKKYVNWYAYGRTQGFSNQGVKLLIPYISDVPRAIISLDEQLLFYSGYAIFVKDEKEAIILKRILESSVFSKFIEVSSKPYSHGYYSYAKNIIKNFSLPNFLDSEIDFLYANDSRKGINKFLEQKYGVDLYGNKE